MINFEKKIIFSHPQKSGGSSISLLLGDNSSDYKHIKHGNLGEIIKEVEELGFSSSDFFKFSVVRNPWERYFSWYKYEIEYRLFKILKDENADPKDKNIALQRLKTPFAEFIKKLISVHGSLSIKRFFCIEDDFALDSVIRFENLNEEIVQILPKLKLEAGIKMPHIMKTTGNTSNYQEVYNKDLKELIAYQCGWEIDKFGYKFDQ